MKHSVAAAVRNGLNDTQFRAGVDLVASAALNATTGLAFWFVAARAFDEADVGVNAALISTMGAVANLASLGMKNGLIRFLPAYGARAKLLVKHTYTATGLCALVSAPIVAIVLAARVTELETLGSWGGVVAFTAACVVWIIFVLQDSVLVALDRTRLIPIANLVHAVAKLALLAVLAFTAPAWGIFAAWTLPVIVIVLWVNQVAFRDLTAVATRAASVTTTSDVDSQPSFFRRPLTRFAAGEEASTILNMVLFGVLPIYVLAELGERASAFYALAWTIAYNLMLVNSQVSTALLAAASQDGDQLPVQARKALRQMALFVIPGALGLVALASFGLRIFGESYAAGGAAVLRLFALAGIANIVVAVAIGVLRARRQVGRLFGLYALRMGIIGGLCLALAPRYGLTGIGWAWLVGESIMAVLLLVTVVRPLRN